MNLRALPLGLFVAVAAFAAHAGSMAAGFVYDDENVILMNRANLEDAGTIPRFLSDPTLFAGVKGNPMFRPVAYASHVLDANLWGWTAEGPRPAGWHLTNLLLHAATAWVLYRLLRRILAPRAREEPFGSAGPDAASAAACLGALWFGLQPVNSEVADYVSSRSESLAALFFLLALLAHHAAWEEGVARGRRLLLVAGSLAAALLSFGSKETGILLPAVAAAIDLWGRGGTVPGSCTLPRLRDAALRALPYAAAAALYLLARRAALGTATVDLAARASMAGAGVDPMVGGGRSLLAHLLTQARVVADYGLLLAFPVDLAPDHGVRVSAALDLPTLTALLAIGVALALVVRATVRGSTAAPLVAVWAAAAAAPSVLVPLNVVMNEHRLYLPSTGLALAAGLGLLAVLRAAARSGHFLRGVAPVAGVFVLFVAVDASRAAAWGDPLLLWSRAAETSPTSWRNQMHVGVEYFRFAKARYDAVDAGDPAGIDNVIAEMRADLDMDEALLRFREAHRLYARSFETRLNLGYIHLVRGDVRNRDADPDAPVDVEEYREAIRWFAAAEEASPSSFRALYNRATAMAKAGMIPEATAEFERLSQDRSRTTMYANPLADLYRRAGRTEDALKMLDLVESIDPAQAGEIALKRAETLTKAARYREAVEPLRRARELLGPEDPRPDVFMARMLVATGLPENLPAAKGLWEISIQRGWRPGGKDAAVIRALAVR